MSMSSRVRIRYAPGMESNESLQRLVRSLVRFAGVTRSLDDDELLDLSVLRDTIRHNLPGAEYIGSGCLARVYILEGYAVRFSRVKVDGTRQYHRSILAGKIKGPMLPEILAWVRIGPLFVSVMPVYQNYYSVDHLEDAVRQYQCVRVASAIAEGGVMVFDNGGLAELYPEEKPYIEVERENPEMYQQVYQMFEEICDHVGDELDVHTGNVMWDAENGRLVVTDPVSWVHSQYS